MKGEGRSSFRGVLRWEIRELGEGKVTTGGRELCSLQGLARGIWEKEGPRWRGMTIIENNNPSSPFLSCVWATFLVNLTVFWFCYQCCLFYFGFEFWIGRRPYAGLSSSSIECVARIQSKLPDNWHLLVWHVIVFCLETFHYYVWEKIRWRACGVFDSKILYCTAQYSRGDMQISCCFSIPRAHLAPKHPNTTRTYYDYPPIGPSILTNKMAVDGPRPAESLRHLACSLAALHPAPWEKVRMYQWKMCSIYSLDWILHIFAERGLNMLKL